MFVKNRIDNEVFSNFDMCVSLTQEEMKFYFMKFQNGDMDAREELIKGNIFLVFRIICDDFKNIPYEKNDLFSCGLYGLIKAVDTYNYDLGYSFSTYATVCIKNQICKDIRNYKKQPKIISLDQIYYDLCERGKTMKDSLVDRKVDILNNYIVSEEYTRVRELLEILDERSRNIMMLYYGFFDNEQFSQSKISKMYNISRARVSQIMIEALKKLRRHFEEQENLKTITDERRK